VAWEDIGKQNKPIVERAWRRVLADWLNWDTSRIESWLKLWEPDLRDEGDGWFYHDNVMRNVVGLLITDDIADRLREQRSVKAPHELMAIEIELESLFSERPDRCSVWSDDFDWSEARRAADGCLARYGTSMAASDNVTAFERRIRER
jgi:hypothetical protein